MVQESIWYFWNKMKSHNLDATSEKLNENQGKCLNCKLEDNGTLLYLRMISMTENKKIKSWGIKRINTHRIVAYRIILHQNKPCPWKQKGKRRLLNEPNLVMRILNENYQILKELTEMSWCSADLERSTAQSRLVLNRNIRKKWKEIHEIDYITRKE